MDKFTLFLILSFICSNCIAYILGKKHERKKCKHELINQNNYWFGESKKIIDSIFGNLEKQE